MILLTVAFEIHVIVSKVAYDLSTFVDGLKFKDKYCPKLELFGKFNQTRIHERKSDYR